ncbi:hypothetical protein Vadar_004290 [Vaccinium darrowii]|uniref:Uncharacterized protein n=1 Tax=Vaccinium darrowii TaxID=229202 RepID=A0ACB7XN22_9ERIC|nr:hypothetical protein Vadar_004290 [Vaccinium darrowii]
MEGGFQALLLRGESSCDDVYSPPSFIGQTADDACIKALYSAMNAQTSSSPFLSFNDEKYLLQSLEYGDGTSVPLALSVDPVAFGYESYDVGEHWQQLKPVDYMDEKLKMPKYETVDYGLLSDGVSTEPPFFDFISKSSGSNSGVFDSTTFGQLPSLLSLEPVQDSFGLTESPKKRVRSWSPSPASSNCFSGLIQPEAAVPLHSELARQRRQRISEKIRCLQKLLPWDKKMDMATMLEEAYKYVKFLQAQVSALQSMPLDSSFPTGNTGNASVFGGLGRLNRQQLLQVMVNSPVVQTTLYSKGLCVYSVEQLVNLKKIAEMKALYQQMRLNPWMIP